MLQWGHFTSTTWYFPIAFQSYCSVVFGRIGTASGNTMTNVNWVTCVSSMAKITITSASIYSPGFGLPNDGRYLSMGI